MQNSINPLTSLDGYLISDLFRTTDIIKGCKIHPFRIKLHIVLLSLTGHFTFILSLKVHGATYCHFAEMSPNASFSNEPGLA